VIKCKLASPDVQLNNAALHIELIQYTKLANRQLWTAR